MPKAQSIKRGSLRGARGARFGLRLAVALVLGAVGAGALAQEFVIRDIRVEGIQRTEAGTVFSYLPLRVGDRYDPERGSAAIRALFATGLFKDVRIEVEGEVGREGCLYYDPNDPMPTDTGITELANILRFEAGSNSFQYGENTSFGQAFALDPIRDPAEITPEMVESIIDNLLNYLIHRSQISLFFSWGNSTMNTPSTPPDTFLVTDGMARRLGYDHGSFVNEIPGAEWHDYETGYYLSLPAGLEYSLTTTGTGAAENILSLAIPLSGWEIQETVYAAFSIPAGVTATTDFSRFTQDWRIHIEGEADVLPTLAQIQEVIGSMYIPYK